MANDYDGSGALLAALLIVLPILLILLVVVYVVSSYFTMKIFEKAGVQGKWRAWVPVYNSMVLGKLGDVSPWVTLGAILASSILGQVPLIGWVLSLAAIAVLVIAAWRVGLKLGHEWYLLLLWLIPGVGNLVWLGILAFGKSGWNTSVPPAPWAGNAFLSDRTRWEGVPDQSRGSYAADAGYPVQQGHSAPAGYQPPPAASYPPPSSGPIPPSSAPQPPVPPQAPDGFRQ